MPLSINVELFRQHYMDVIACKNEVENLLTQYPEAPERLREHLTDIINSFGRESVNKVVANAIQQSMMNGDEKILQWAKSVPVQQFFFETDNVLNGYVPKNVSSDKLLVAAAELIAHDKQKQIVTSNDGLDMELIKSTEHASFLSYTNEQKQTIYLVMKMHVSPTTPPFNAEHDVQEMFLRYQDGLEKYNQYLQYANMRKMLSDKLYDEFQDFKAAILCKDSTEIFDSAYMISKLQNFHIVVDNITVTSDQIELLMKRKTVLQDLYTLSMGSLGEQEDESIVVQYLEDCSNSFEDEELEM